MVRTRSDALAKSAPQQPLQPEQKQVSNKASVYSKINNNNQASLKTNLPSAENKKQVAQKVSASIHKASDSKTANSLTNPQKPRKKSPFSRRPWAKPKSANEPLHTAVDPKKIAAQQLRIKHAKANFSTNVSNLSNPEARELYESRISTKLINNRTFGSVVRDHLVSDFAGENLDFFDLQVRSPGRAPPEIPGGELITLSGQSSGVFCNWLVCVEPF